MTRPEKPNVEGLTPEQAQKVLDAHQREDQLYTEHLLGKTTLTDDEQKDLGKAVGAWARQERERGRF